MASFQVNCQYGAYFALVLSHVSTKKCFSPENFLARIITIDNHYTLILARLAPNKEGIEAPLLLTGPLVW
jgi:hypothetical protein